MCDIARCNVIEHQPACALVEKVQQFSLARYLSSAARESWSIVCKGLLLLCFIGSAAFYYLAIFRSIAAGLFIASCVAAAVVLPILEMIVMDARVRITCSRIRSGLCTVCGYPVSTVVQDIIKTGEARVVICSECGTQTIGVARHSRVIESHS